MFCFVFFNRTHTTETAGDGACKQYPQRPEEGIGPSGAGVVQSPDASDGNHFLLGGSIHYLTL